MLLKCVLRIQIQLNGKLSASVLTIRPSHFTKCLSEPIFSSVRVSQCFVEQNWFHLIGIICGLAIYNSTVVDLHFPLALYKKLLDVAPTLEDFKELSPTEAR